MRLFDGLAADALGERWNTPRFEARDRVTSTLDVIHELAEGGAPAGTLVLAEEQVSGRGRRGSTWHSPPGAGIWLSYLIRPTFAVQTGVLSLRLGMAVVDTLHALGVGAMVKWPNDVVIEGRKVAGVLSEARWLGSRLDWVAVGIGINVRGPLPGELAGRAIAVGEVCHEVSRVGLLDKLVPRLHDLSMAAELNEDELSAFSRHDWLARREIAEPVSGLGCGVAPDGALLVDGGCGIQRVVGGGIVTS